MRLTFRSMALTSTILGTTLNSWIGFTLAMVAIIFVKGHTRSISHKIRLQVPTCVHLESGSTTLKVTVNFDLF